MNWNVGHEHYNHRNHDRDRRHRPVHDGRQADLLQPDDRPKLLLRHEWRSGLLQCGNPDVGEGTTSTTTGIVATGQSTTDGKPIYYNQTTGQSFYYGTNGVPVYYNATTGVWDTTNTAAATAAGYVATGQYTSAGKQIFTTR